MTTTTYPPVPSEMGTFLAQLGAIDVMNQYRARTLPEDQRRFVDLTIEQCWLQGDDAQRWVDGVVALTVREWAAAAGRRRRRRGEPQHDGRLVRPRGADAPVAPRDPQLISEPLARGDEPLSPRCPAARG